MPYENRTYWSDLHERHTGNLSAVGYPALGHAFNRIAYQRRLQAAEDILAGLTCSVGSVFEAAVGVGAYEPLWRRLGCRRWTGVDISERAVADLRERFPSGRFDVVDITRPWSTWPIPANARFDLVSAVDVLYHIVDDDAFSGALESLAHFTAPGGVLLVSDVFVETATMAAPHVRRRPLSAYSTLLERAGLQPAARAPVFAILGDPIRRRGFHWRDETMYWTWRLMQKAIRTLPSAAREPVGSGLARCLSPIDALLCRAGWSREINLELATFRHAR